MFTRSTLSKRLLFKPIRNVFSNSELLHKSTIYNCSHRHTSNCTDKCNHRPTRVRYAPSPTGSLHLGGLRTALYNYIVARQDKGQCLLRIEDTDRTRLVQGAVTQLIRDFDWISLSFDEGPAPLKGEVGPYTQSERLDLYQKYCNQLLQSGHAYRCFCTAERLDFLRQNQNNKGSASTYDRLCMSLSPEEVKERLHTGTPHVVRMKIPEGTTVVNDLIRGEVVFQNKLIDDQVLMKSDGYPTYHLANIVDDHLMGITQVIRGEEWLPSACKHVLLYQMFGWEAPKFAHLPLLLREDGSKLSKRFRDSSLDYYIELGYLPEAIVNFVALLGWHPSDAQTKALHRGELADGVLAKNLKEEEANKVIENISIDTLNTEEDADLLKSLLSDGKKKKTKAKKVENTEKTNSVLVGSETSEVFTIDQIITLFDISRVQKAGAAVEMAKLNYYQGQHWKRALELDINRLAAFVTDKSIGLFERVKNNKLTDEDKELIGPVTYGDVSFDITDQDHVFGQGSSAHRAAHKTTLSGPGANFVPNPAIIKGLRTTRDHPCKTTEFPYKCLFIWFRPVLTSEHALEMKKTIWVDASNEVDSKGKTRVHSVNILNAIIDYVNSVDNSYFDNYEHTHFNAGLKKLTKDMGIGLKDVYLPLRFALSGTTEGPGVADQICALGKEEVVYRINKCLEISN